MILVSFMFLFKLLVARLKEAFNNAKLKRDDDLRNTLILTTGEIGRYRRLFVYTKYHLKLCCDRVESFSLLSIIDHKNFHKMKNN